MTHFHTREGWDGGPPIAIAHHFDIFINLYQRVFVPKPFWAGDANASGYNEVKN